MDRKEYFKRKMFADSITIQNYHPMFTDNDTAFLQNELTAVEAEMIEYFPVDTSHRKLWQVVNLGPGLKSIEYHELLRSGQSKYGAQGETEIPNASVKRMSIQLPVRKAKIKYSFEIEDVGYMERSGFNLEAQDALAAKEGNEYTFNGTAFFGKSKAGLKGYFSHATESNLSVITPVAGAGVGADTTWETKTADEIYDDCMKLKRAGREDTKGQVDNNVLAVGIKNYGHLESKRFKLGSVLTSETVLNRLLTNKIFDRVEMCPELDSNRSDVYKDLEADEPTVSALIKNKNVAIAFSDRKDVFKRHIPLELTPIPLQIHGFTHTVYLHADDSGLLLYRKYGGAYLLNT